MDEQPDWTYQALRAHWLPTRERLVAEGRNEPTRVRIHRACSWLKRVEEIADDDAMDAMLIYRWIAMNSLYGLWDPAAREPVPDRQSLGRFLDRVLKLDADGRIAAILEAHRKLVMSLFDDEYLTKYFWEEPTDERARKTKKTKFDARTWYQQQQYGMIMQRTLERIYLMRCQLVHGAATFRSTLNRTALRRCATMLDHLLPQILLVIMDHGVDEDWGPLCYPPIR